MFSAQTEEKIADACNEFSVRALYVFGSYATGKMDASSDVDLLVDFDREGFDGAFEQFMGFKMRMEQIFERPVDLVSAKRFRNPYFQQAVDRQKKLIYAA